MTAHKTRVVRAAVAVLILLLVCTVLARSIYSLMLPEVTAVEPTRGVLTYTSQHSGKVLPTKTQDTAQAIVQWSAELEDARQALSLWPSFSCAFDVIPEGSLMLANEQCEGQLIAAEYNTFTGLYDLQAALQTESVVPAGTAVEITTTVYSAEYLSLIPISCVMTDENGQPYVYRIQKTTSMWGQATRVTKVAALIHESNHLYAALNGSISLGDEEPPLYAAYPSRGLIDGEEVRVID